MEEKIMDILFNPTVGKFAAIILGVGIIWLIIKGIQKKVFSRIKDNDNRYRAKKFSGFVGYFLTIVLFTIVFSDKLGGLTIALGVAGAGIAFALQEVIVSFAGWLAIMFGGFFKSGDRIELGGIQGDVMDIGVLRTTLMETGKWVDGDLYNGRIVFVANSFVFKEPVFNYSGEFPFLWDEIKLPIQYGSDYGKVEEILLKASKTVVGDLSDQSLSKWRALQTKYRLEDAQTEPLISLIANDNWVEFTLRYVVNYRRRRVTKSALFKLILNMVDEVKDEVKFASATFQLVEGSAVQVDLDKNR